MKKHPDYIIAKLCKLYNEYSLILIIRFNYIYFILNRKILQLIMVGGRN